MGYLFEVVLSLKLEYDDMFYGHVVSIDMPCVRVDKKLFLNHEPPRNTLGPDKTPQQSASRYLKDLVEVGVLVAQPFGKEKLFIHPKLMKILSHDRNHFEAYDKIFSSRTHD